MIDKEIVDYIERHGFSGFQGAIERARMIAGLGEYGPMTIRELFSLAMQLSRQPLNPATRPSE